MAAGTKNEQTKLIRSNIRKGHIGWRAILISVILTIGFFFAFHWIFRYDPDTFNSAVGQLTVSPLYPKYTISLQGRAFSNNDTNEWVWENPPSFSGLLSIRISEKDRDILKEAEVTIVMKFAIDGKKPREIRDTFPDGWIVSDPDPELWHPQLDRVGQFPSRLYTLTITIESREPLPKSVELSPIIDGGGFEGW